MNLRPVFGFPLLLAFAISTLPATAAELALSHATLAHLTALKPGEAATLDAFPAGPNSAASIRFERVQIYAADAHIYVMTAAGKQEVPRSTRVFLRGYASDGSARVAMSLNPDGSFVEGNGTGPEGSFVLQASVDANATNKLNAKLLESTLPAGFQFNFRCGNENQNLDMRSMDLHSGENLADQLHAATSSVAVSPISSASAFRLATIGIDTDSLFMSRLFSNNTTNAVNWIASMFNTMNTMYEGDLQVQLVIGTTILRTSAANDPYTGATDSPSDTHDLDIFGNYWMTNESSVKRSFAILLSGQIASTSNSCSAAGIAWIDEYCQNGQTSGSNTVGSYSVEQVCTSINIDPNGAFDARIVGHEIGHNFGAYHTHCTNTTSGAAPSGTNTIDQCYNIESGCYAGATTSCPAGGAGTIMSYCNFTSVSGCAAGTQNLLHFHSTQINQVLLPEIASNTPSCLSSSDVIFADGFQ